MLMCKDLLSFGIFDFFHLLLFSNHICYFPIFSTFYLLRVMAIQSGDETIVGNVLQKVSLLL